MVKPTYSNGDVQCVKCSTWILKKDIPEQTTRQAARQGPGGRLRHLDCGVFVRTRSRQPTYAMRRRGQIYFSALGTPLDKAYNAKRDILKNKQRLEELLVRSSSSSSNSNSSNVK